MHSAVSGWRKIGALRLIDSELGRVKKLINEQLAGGKGHVEDLLEIAVLDHPLRDVMPDSEDSAARHVPSLACAPAGSAQHPWTDMAGVPRLCSVAGSS